MSYKMWAAEHTFFTLSLNRQSSAKCQASAAIQLKCSFLGEAAQRVYW